MKERIQNRIFDLRNMQSNARTEAERQVIQAEIIRLYEILDSL